MEYRNNAPSRDGFTGAEDRTKGMPRRNDGLSMASGRAEIQKDKKQKVKVETAKYRNDS